MYDLLNLRLAKFLAKNNSFRHGDLNATFLLDGLTISEQIDHIIADVVTLAGIANLPSDGTSLLVKLNNAKASVANGNIEAAVGQLGAFINQINAFYNAGRITAAQAQHLIDDVNCVIEGLLN